MKERVYVSRRLPGADIDRLRQLAEVIVWPGDEPPNRGALVEQARGCAALIVMLTERIDGSLLDELGGEIRAVANVAVGYDNIDIDACTARGIQVGNTPGVLTDATADLTWALILAVQRRLIEGVDAVRNGKWPPWNPTWLCGKDLRGQTLGIVGYGEIGHAVARRAEPFGVKVIHSTRGRGVPLEQLLAEADIVSLHCPMNPETEKLIGTRAFGLMKDSSVLINTARGGIVDQAALVAALQSGTIRAAGLDVATVEPVPTDDPLLSLTNCTVLPHLGSATIETRSKMAGLAVDNVIAALAGHSMPHRVNDSVVPLRKASTGQ